MKKITIFGWNYEGAHFRGIASATDNTSLIITLQAKDEGVICDWILEQFAYGPRDDIQTFKDLVEGYDLGDIPNSDGCGGVCKIKIGNRIVWKDDYFLDYFKKPLKLGTWEVLSSGGINDLNNMVEEAMDVA